MLGRVSAFVDAGSICYGTAAGGDQATVCVE
jgi:hypothetical protein